MTDTAKLKDCIMQSGYKQSFVAKHLGLTSYGFARKRDNKSDFTATEIELLCELLGIYSASDRMEIFFAKK